MFDSCIPPRRQISAEDAPAAANKMICARRASRCGVVPAPTRRRSSASSAASNTIGAATYGIGNLLDPLKLHACNYQEAALAVESRPAGRRAGRAPGGGVKAL